MYPLLITVAQKHKDSHETFFNKWEKWIDGLEEFDVFPEFIWISEEGGDTKEHPQSDQWPAHKERNISISEVNKGIGMKYKIEKRRRLIQKSPRNFGGRTSWNGGTGRAGGTRRGAGGTGTAGGTNEIGRT